MSPLPDHSHGNGAPLAKAAQRWLVAFTAMTLVAAMLTVSCGAAGSAPHRAAIRPQTQYLEAVNASGPPQDPQLLFLLMAQYANANQQERGVEFFSSRLRDFGPRLTNVQKSFYLSAISLLRAQHASDIDLLHRIGYVKETIAMLDQARQLSGGQVFVVNWIAGVVYARLPSFFHQRQAAREVLVWCLGNVDKAPDAGWLREVYRTLALVSDGDGDRDKAQELLRRSGYTELKSPIILTTPFSEDRASGHAFSPRRITEIIPHRVYALSGFEFTEYYFVVSDDGRELIGIDAGTRPDSAKLAYEALRAYAPGLPELTTVFFTHSHWDHVGGYSYFRSLSSRIRFYARANYQQEIERDLEAPEPVARPFFGANFNIENVRGFKPDVSIDSRTELTIGGTHIALVPIQGGETEDGMFIYLPDQRVLFAGDFIMPYLGAPFVTEGSLPGLFAAIDVVEQLQPRILLHGHRPLTQIFTSVPQLVELRQDLEWLRDQVTEAVRRGEPRDAIQAANLTPPGLLRGRPDVYLPYLVLREHVIDRLFSQQTGYWRADLQGLDQLGRADRGELLTDYLGVSESQLSRATERLMADGRYELAASLLDSVQGTFEHDPTIQALQRRVYLKLMEKTQNTDPFKFILYALKAGEQVPQMSAPASTGEQRRESREAPGARRGTTGR